MASVAGALVLNIGTLSKLWIDAMLLAGKAANRAGAPVVLDPVGAGATRLRTETAQRILDEVEIAVVRGNQAEVATLAGRQAEIRGVESIGAADSGADLAKVAATELGCVVAVTGPVDHVSDGEQLISVSNGHELLGDRERDGMHVVGDDRLLPGCGRRSAARGCCRGSRRLRCRRRGRRGRSEGPRLVPRRTSTTRCTTSTRRRSTRGRSSRDEAARGRQRPRNREGGGRGRRDGHTTSPQECADGPGRRRRTAPSATSLPRSSSTTTCRLRSPSVRTACISVNKTPERNWRSPQA